MTTSPRLLVNCLGKKYCVGLRRSIYYGLTDIARDILGRPLQGDRLRPEEFWALRDVSFELDEGECLGVIGANGSGKSSLLKLLAGIMLPDRGELSVRGRTGSLIAIGAGFHPLLSGRENIFLQGAILGLGKNEIRSRLEEIIDFSGLGSFIDTPVRNYSSGMYLRLGFAIATRMRPEILLIDEVLAVGDARFRHRCYEHIRKLVQEGTSVVLVSHSVNDLLRTTTRSLVLDQGAVLFDGDTEAAIAVYQKNLIRQGEDAPDPDMPVRITDLKLSSRTADGDNRFHTQDDIRIEFAVVSDRELPHIELRFVIDSPVYGPIATVTSLVSRIGIVAGSGRTSRYAMVLPAIPLLRGAYLMHLHAFDAGTGTYLGSYRNLASFEIVGTATTSHSSRHLLRLESLWYRWDDQRQLYEQAPDRPPEEGKVFTYG